MMKKAALILCMIAAVLNPAPSWAAEKPLKVVATVSGLGEIAKTVGGEHVEVHTIVPPRLNPHYIQPKPSDVLKVKRADLFIWTGLHLELWLGPLMNAVGRPDVMPGGARALDMSAGIEILEAHHEDEAPTRLEGEMYLHGNPHYWLNPENAAILARTVAGKLSELTPQHAQDYQRNVEAFIAKLDQKMEEWRQQITPYKGRELVAYHNEWPYLMAFTGLKTEHFLEPKPGIPPTPRQLQSIEEYVRKEGIPAILKAGHEPKEAAHQVAQRTGVPVIVLAHTVGELPECSDYFSMFDYNIAQLVEAFSQGGGNE